MPAYDGTLFTPPAPVAGGLVGLMGPLVVDGGQAFGASVVEDRESARVLEFALQGRAQERAAGRRRKS